jgi:hypothetical protein
VDSFFNHNLPQWMSAVSSDLGRFMEVTVIISIYNFRLVDIMEILGLD